MSAGFLSQMAQSSRTRAALARRELPESALIEHARMVPPAPSLTLHPDGFDVIAEMKLRSPAAGQLRVAADEDVGARVCAYAAAGAAAVSVLTEPSHFDGALVHLEVAVAALRPQQVPAMRKDFLVDPYQVWEARAAGAGGVLLIIRMLSRPQLWELYEAARTAGLWVLLEAFDEADLEAADELAGHGQAGAASGPEHGHAGAMSAPEHGRAGPAPFGAVSQPPALEVRLPQLLVGVNCRDLTTLQVVPERLLQLAPFLPAGVPRVAESGVGTAQDARRVAAAGYDLALVGSALMTGADPGALTRAMLASGRAGRREPGRRP
ncbi:MAG TPA: indole-3-glycerol-phosphate synthase [Steroidobacteraceae bacterium]|nr:indole-3-glycerol-phosphate synthase [Steroidobacteraceae bacterium]